MEMVNINNDDDNNNNILTYVKNKISPKEIQLSPKNKIIEETDEVLEHRQIFDISPNNIIYKEKYIFGIKDNLSYLILMLLAFFAIYVIWFFFIYPYFYFNSVTVSYVITFSIVTITYILGQFFHLKCFFTEPGIIPRNYPIYINKFSIEEKNKCEICNIYKPSKCHHCTECDNCVEEYDMHCKYVSNCIGKRNHKFFFFFILFDFLFLSLVLITSIIQFGHLYIDYHVELNQIFSRINVSIILIIIILVLVSINVYLYRDNRNLFKFVIMLSNIIYIIGFYYGKNRTKSYLPIFVSPFNFALLSSCLPISYYLFLLLIKQMSMISIGITIHEYNILTKKNDNVEENNNEDNVRNNNDLAQNEGGELMIRDINNNIRNEILKFSFADAYKNMKIFFTTEIPPSLFEVKNL